MYNNLNVIYEMQPSLQILCHIVRTYIQMNDEASALIHVDCEHIKLQTAFVSTFSIGTKWDSGRVNSLQIKSLHKAVEENPINFDINERLIVGRKLKIVGIFRRKWV